ncbi:Transposable element Tc3 transposase [Lucilia cuprina]|nr:Transposable element Tc3 transposase [Lucilia cuprina]
MRKKFNLDGPDGFNTYCRDLRKKKGSLMGWGVFCADSMLDLAFPSTKMNSTVYIKIHEDKLVPFLERCNAQDHIFQQYNPSIYNPIVNIWGMLSRKIYAENRQYAIVSHLKEAVISSQI